MEKLRNLLRKKDGTKEMLRNCLDFVKESKYIIIFGAGVGGKILYDVLKKEKLNVKIRGYTDNNSLKFGFPYISEHIDIIPPQNLFKMFGISCRFVIASSAYKEIKQQLLDYGFKVENILLCNLAFMDLEYTDREFIWNNLENFQRAYDRMQDKKSRKIFEYILNYKITKDNIFLDMMDEYVDDENKQYFDSGLFDFYSEESFLDLGAYIGDTLNVYNKLYTGKWKAYYGFEADKDMFDKLCSYVEKQEFENEKRVLLYNYAAWNEDGVVYFDNMPGSSKMETFTEDLKCRVQTCRIDDILGEDTITFVKLDIEGAEYNALDGMRNILMKNKPIIALAVYHQRDDFYLLTDLIEDICPGKYTFYLRQYRYTPTETICYAVPKSRAKG